MFSDILMPWVIMVFNHRDLWWCCVMLVMCKLHIDRTWNDVRCPTKWRESSIRQTLQVRVTSDAQKIQSSDWPKWHCTLWHNVNFCIFVGHRTSFQAVCRYVNYACSNSSHYYYSNLYRTHTVSWHFLWHLYQ